MAGPEKAAAAAGDFAIAVYNPSSKKRKDHLKQACGILLTRLAPDTPCGYVRKIGREGTQKKTCTLEELRTVEADMFTTVFIGNSRTRIAGDWMITPRGFQL